MAWLLEEARIIRAMHGLRLLPNGDVVCELCGPWRRWPCSRFTRANEVVAALSGPDPSAGLRRVLAPSRHPR